MTLRLPECEVEHLLSSQDVLEDVECARASMMPCLALNEMLQQGLHGY